MFTRNESRLWRYFNSDVNLHERRVIHRKVLCNNCRPYWSTILSVVFLTFNLVSASQTRDVYIRLTVSSLLLSNLRSCPFPFFDSLSQFDSSIKSWCLIRSWSLNTVSLSDFTSSGIPFLSSVLLELNY